MNKKAFSMIEILISVSIIIILAIVATTTSNNLKNNSNNSKVVSDLNTIENALVSFKMETNSIAIPGGNNNNFDKD
jgi:type II secretory pathway pseudopilin PulG